MRKKALFIGGTARKLAGLEWDCVCDFIGFVPAHPELQEPDPAFDAWCDRVIAAMEQAKASLR